MAASFWSYIRKVFSGLKMQNSRMLGTYPDEGGIFKANEGSDFPNIYPSIMPPDGSWGTFTDNQNVPYTIHPLIASELKMEQVWDFYQSMAPDPYLGEQDLSVDHNYDGDTKFFTNGPITPT